jgi:archaemetzincin
MAFIPPGPDARLRAIGALEGLPPELRRAFAPDNDFDPVPLPRGLDWLNVARERGQTFDSFTRTTSNRPQKHRSRIYLKPVGEFSTDQAALLHDLQRFGGAFFVQQVSLLPTVTIEGSGITTRRNRYTDVLQLKTRDILPLLAREVPADGACVLGVTAHDLYPHDTWSFVFGEALLDDRVGVFSIARLDPRFYDRPSEDPSLLLTRSCKVLAHETCHMLGIRHCIFFNCLMNGSNHLGESDRRPLHLCPLDLRKLHWSLGFDVVERYQRLLTFWCDAGVSVEAQWIGRRLSSVKG